MHWKKHHGLIENHPADQRRKPKSPPLEQHGTWWCHYTEHHPNFTKRRIRMSLQTPTLAEARVKRDRWFSKCENAGAQ
jgi:hypothetical protein